MKALQVHCAQSIAQRHITLTGSKSETNRVLLLKALYSNLELLNDSNAHDVAMMKQGLSKTSGTVDIHHAGTAMRFLTAYFATLEGSDVLLTGSARMKQRPIKILVDALRALGAEVTYAENEGFPPLQIKGKALEGGNLRMRADVSSQYLSSLCLVAPKFQKGLSLTFEGALTSIPYLKMTLKLLESIGISSELNQEGVRVFSKKAIDDQALAVESDWSAASYYYSIVALSPAGTSMQLSVLKNDSLQGDRVLADLYADFGVETRFDSNTVHLHKSGNAKDAVAYDLRDAPDIAQTIAVTAAGLGMHCMMTGLHTLPIKETDRLAAMKAELEKCGVKVTITDESLEVHARKQALVSATISTYNDHRMAMAFAPMALCVPLIIEDPMVVEKSYPDFWKDLESLGFDCTSKAE
jgi:3-phosphoshikimate 1-carboxyvinyltransferase